MSSNPPSLAVISLPNEEQSGMNFEDSSYFKSYTKFGLPTPEELRALPLDKRPKGRALTVSIQDRGLFVKYGADVKVSEAVFLRSIRKVAGDGVPMPEVYGWRRDKGEVFIYMQLIQGPTLESKWNYLGADDKIAINQHLKQIMTVLRHVEQKSSAPFIGSLAHEWMTDYVFEFLPRPPNLFSDAKHFHNWLTELVWKTAPPSARQKDPFRAYLPDNAAIKLTHADLHPRNIIISSTSPLKILAIVDWQFAGWYPDYWEYYKAWSTSDLETDWATQSLQTFLPKPDDQVLDILSFYLTDALGVI